MPTKFVFWRGAGYIPMIINERDQWYSNEFNETWRTSGGQGCQEPMSDREGFHNYARIIEDTPARAVVQWRCPLSPIYHPAFVIENWGSDATASLKIDGIDQAPGPEFRQGVMVDEYGTYALVIWLDYEATSTTYLIC